MVEKAPHFFGSFSVGGIFFKSTAFFQACKGKEKAVVLSQIGVGTFEIVIGLSVIGGNVLKIGNDKEADFVFIGGGGLFQVLQDIVYVCSRVGRFEIKKTTSACTTKNGHRYGSFAARRTPSS